jgi:hypothetical protein
MNKVERMAAGLGPERYFLDTDDSCHWYLVPLSRKAEWAAWVEEICSAKPEDEIDWEERDYAIRINGPSSIVFEEPCDIDSGKSLT